MENHTEELNRHSRRPPWNKGKLIGAKPPLRPRSRVVHKNQASIDAIEIAEKIDI